MGREEKRWVLRGKASSAPSHFTGLRAEHQLLPWGGGGGRGAVPRELASARENRNKRPARLEFPPLRTSKTVLKEQQAPSSFELPSLTKLSLSVDLAPCANKRLAPRSTGPQCSATLGPPSHLAEGEHSLLGAHHTAFQHDEVIGHFAVVDKATLGKAKRSGQCSPSMGLEPRRTRRAPSGSGIRSRPTTGRSQRESSGSVSAV